MSGLLSLLNRSRGDARVIETILTRIDREQTVVRMELEQSLIRFNTRLSMRRNAVVVAKPAALGAELQAGSYVRFKLPNDVTRVLRMEVVTPNFNLTNNQPVFICKPPTQFADPPRRKSERFDTARFRNLSLQLPGHAEEFRIVDISQNGCRVMTQYQKPREKLPASEAIGDALINLGKHVRVQLATVIPRTFNGASVGLSFSVDPNGDNHKLLAHLLRSLDTAQQNALRAASRSET